MLVFQILLLVLLALPLLAGPAGLLASAVAYAVVLAASAYKALSFDDSQRQAAWMLLAFFSVLSLGILAALLLGASVFLIGGASAGLLALFFAFLAWRFSTLKCDLIGWVNQFAIVRVPKSLVSVVPAGVYAVTCPKKPTGKTVKVRFSFFKKEGKVEQ